MHTSISCLTAALALLLAGCAGPTEKLGRGMRNTTEFVRMGEIRRSIEQTALWDGPQQAFTTGLIRGFNRSVVRTALGVYEVVTFPVPPYGPMLTSTNLVFPDPSMSFLRYPWGGFVLTADPPYPASHAPGYLSDQIFATDEYLGFSGGDIAPMIPGARFSIFDN